ncbi:hypothetical protein DICPUDRAFT_82903 [Dictyostelium purpureum]|uniref:Uncharacterized protein n=1 Tax=Dictyostelium purpureum TaxID=5786 RepID=F0ZXZ2_DICPU|nr:uncharacterized protein DICPUDRAFT_82903 [Dictyostelium purpureum]EGC31197.1 hypothetical protein DICPUDRAFT_82903 [Dictyostelium purpureum]|eukprot:XP_003292286.1 hypothetical protein DICPUDRAFT_82903 [Dictyostelium purpureum]
MEIIITDTINNNNSNDNNHTNCCIVENCILNKDILKELEDVELHFLFHFKKCLECNYPIDHKLMEVDNIFIKNDLKDILSNHKSSIRHKIILKKTSFYRKRFNSVIDMDTFFSKTNNQEKIVEHVIKRIDIKNENNNENNHKINDENNNENNNNHKNNHKKNKENNHKNNNENNNNVNKNVNKNKSNDDYHCNPKKIKLSHNENSNKFPKIKVNDQENLKYIYTTLAEDEISINTIQKIFENKKLVEALQSSDLKTLEKNFINLPFQLKPIIFKSNCINPDSCVCTKDSLSPHTYWSFDIIELFKCILLTDLVNDISFYPIDSVTFSLYSSSQHFFRIFNENSKSLNIVLKINIDIEEIDGGLCNVVYTSIGNTVSCSVNQRFYLGCFPLCVSFQEAFVNILKPLLYSREEVYATIKIPPIDPTDKSNPLPVKAIEEAVSRKEFYTKHKRIKELESKIGLNENFINQLISNLNKIINEEKLKNKRDQHQQNEQEKEIKEKDDDVCKHLNNNTNFHKILKSQSELSKHEPHQYNNLGFSNIKGAYDNNPQYSSFFSIKFTVLDVSGNNSQASDLFSQIFSKPEKPCCLCEHPKNQIINFDQDYLRKSIDDNFTPLFLRRMKEKIADPPTVDHFFTLFKAILGIDYSSIPFFLLNFKDLYNPMDILFIKELDLLFSELSFLLSLISSLNKFETIPFVEDTNLFVQFVLELQSKEILTANHSKCLFLHLKYFFKLKKESFVEEDLSQLNNDIIDHHKLFMEIYKEFFVKDNQEKILLNLHSSKHWRFLISMYGSPIYYSIVSYNKELNRNKIFSIAEHSNQYIENLSKQFNLINEKSMKPPHITFGKIMDGSKEEIYSFVRINGRIYKPNYHYCIYGGEADEWYCQIQKITNENVYIFYFESDSRKKKNGIIGEVFKNNYTLNKNKAYAISLIKDPETLLERVFPILLDGYYYFPSNGKE